MAELKTKVTQANVLAFISEFATTDQKRKDSKELIKLMQQLSGCKAKMWGPSIIGFGSYHYQSQKSKQEGEMPLVGFSPRKAAISLYVYTGHKEHAHLLKDLGKFKMGKACIYVNKLSDISIPALEKLILTTINYLKTTYGNN
jgi:hypothetical protein